MKWEFFKKVIERVLGKVCDKPLEVDGVFSIVILRQNKRNFLVSSNLSFLEKLRFKNCSED